MLVSWASEVPPVGAAYTSQHHHMNPLTGWPFSWRTPWTFSKPTGAVVAVCAEASRQTRATAPASKRDLNSFIIVFLVCPDAGTAHPRRHHRIHKRCLHNGKTFQGI